MKDNSIKITSGLHKDISTSIVIDGKKYLILTEDLEPRGGLITTKVYLGGKILFSRTLEVGDSGKRRGKAGPEKIIELVRKHHERIAETLRREDSNAPAAISTCRRRPRVSSARCTICSPAPHAHGCPLKYDQVAQHPPDHYNFLL